MAVPQTTWLAWCAWSWLTLAIGLGVWSVEWDGDWTTDGTQARRMALSSLLLTYLSVCVLLMLWAWPAQPGDRTERYKYLGCLVVFIITAVFLHLIYSELFVIKYLYAVLGAVVVMAALAAEDTVALYRLWHHKRV